LCDELHDDVRESATARALAYFVGRRLAMCKTDLRLEEPVCDEFFDGVPHVLDCVENRDNPTFGIGKFAFCGRARDGRFRHIGNPDLRRETSGKGRAFLAYASRFPPPASRFGSVNEKTLPRPTSLSTRMCPPCASTMPFAIDKPSPEPRTRAPS